MSTFMSTLRHNSDKKTVMENKIQNNVRQFKIGKFLCDITKYFFWICGVLHFFLKYILTTSVLKQNKPLEGAVKWKSFFLSQN
jgi:hypothetical protein